MYAVPLSSERGCWDRRFWCCKYWGERTEEQLKLMLALKFASTRLLTRQKLTVDAVVLGRIADNRVAAAGRETVLAVNLGLAAVLAGRTSPDVNMRLAVPPVGVYDALAVSLLLPGVQR